MHHTMTFNFLVAALKRFKNKLVFSKIYFNLEYPLTIFTLLY